MVSGGGGRGTVFHRDRDRCASWKSGRAAEVGVSQAAVGEKVDLAAEEFFERSEKPEVLIGRGQGADAPKLDEEVQITAR